MSKVEALYKEYNELKDNFFKNRTLIIREDLKNKLIELDYAINSEYETKLDSDFPMTTTLEKEENRLERLIDFIEDKSKEQKKLVEDYKKITGEVIELSYLKYTDNLRNYKERLNNVRKVLTIIAELKNISKNKDNKKDIKLKVIKNKLMKKELLNLLYEFCLIDNLDIKEIEIDKLIQTNEFNEESSKDENPAIEIPKPIELPKKENIKVEKKKDIPKVENKKNVIKQSNKKQEIEKKEILEIKPSEIKKETNENIKVIEPKLIDKKENIKPVESVVEQPEEQKEEKVLTTMPIVDKIGSVVPVNVFESLQKTEEKLPDVVLPSNGLKDDKNDIFVDTTDMFGEEEKK